MPETIKSVAISAFLAILLTLSHVLLKSAAKFPFFSQPWLINIFLSISLYGIVFFLYAFTLKYFEVSVIYPIYTALSIIGVALMGFFYFHEVLNMKKILGLILLIVSIVLIS